jgi:pimeloyl-ACP methyl ester carboxylesterase
MKTTSHLADPDVRIPVGATYLHGDLHLFPETPSVVLFAHGSGSSRHSLRNKSVAQVIRDHGCGTLLFDLLTSDEEIEDRATAALRFDIDLLAQRLVAATRWIRDRCEPGCLKIGYFGSSTGGAAALVAAAELGKEIGAVVSRGGRPDLAGPAISRVESPTLLIVGERDEEVLRLNANAFEKLDCEKDLKIVPGATHLFEEQGALQIVAQLAAEWFQEHLEAGVSSTPIAR